MTPPLKRSGPTAKQGRPRHNTDTSDFNPLYRPQDGFTAPTPEDRADAEVIGAAEARGFRLATRCTRCGQWVVAAKSVALHMGPVCRAKVAAEVVSDV